MRQTHLAAPLALLLLATPLRCESLVLPWSQISPVVANRKVNVVQPDGSRISGRVAAVESQALILKSSKASQSVPREEVTAIEVNRPTHRWRVLGTTLGALSGVTVGAVTAWRIDGVLSKGNGGAAAGLAIAGGLTAAGYFLGRAADHRTLHITIAPEPNPK